jgi:hypothetical protein
MFWNTKVTKTLPPVILYQILNQKHDSVQVGFQIIIVGTMQSASIWDVIMCSTVEVHQWRNLLPPTSWSKSTSSKTPAEADSISRSPLKYTTLLTRINVNSLRHTNMPLLNLHFRGSRRWCHTLSLRAYNCTEILNMLSAQYEARTLTMYKRVWLVQQVLWKPWRSC